jgi:hypothetical protein
MIVRSALPSFFQQRFLGLPRPWLAAASIGIEDGGFDRFQGDFNWPAGVGSCMCSQLLAMDDVLTLDRPAVFCVARGRPVLFGAWLGPTSCSRRIAKTSAFC